MRSVLLRHADSSIKDCDYHSGAFTGYFSRMAYGIVHMSFVYCYWTFVSRSHNLKDLDVLLRCLVSLAGTAPYADVLVVDDCSPAQDKVNLLGFA